MKKLPLILGILILIDTVYFAYVNYGQMISFNYRPFIQEYKLDAAYLYLTLGLYGALGSFLICYYFISSLKDRLKKQTRNVEKAYIDTQESSDKVKALQAKIDTLEMALKEALKQK